MRAGFLIALCLGVACCASAATGDRKALDAGSPTPRSSASDKVKHGAVAKTGARKHRADYSGKPKKGKASYYARRFAGKKMADGTRMNPRSNVAASKTLPLGTKAKVTNLENGKTAEVEIRDRGPHVAGRIIDVTPKTAERLDLKDDGTARVEVSPIEVPLPDGRIKPGAATAVVENSGKH